MITTQRVDVGPNAPTRLAPPMVRRSKYDVRSSVVVQAAGEFFVGGPDVSEETGFRVAPGVPFSIEFNNDGDELHAVTADGTVTVSVLQQGV